MKKALSLIGKVTLILFTSFFFTQAAIGLLEATPLPSAPGNAPTGTQFGDGSKPDIFAQENGKLHVAWKYQNNVRYRYYNGSSWQSIENVPIGGVSVSSKAPPGICADSNGKPHIVWGDDTGNIYYINKTGGSWSNRQTVVSNSNPDAYLMRDPHIAVASNGIRHLIWRQKDLSSGKGTIWYKKYQNGSWGGATKISTGSGTAKRPHIALGSNDSFHVVWRQRGGPNNSYEAMYRKWTNGSWSGVEFATYTNEQCNEDPHIVLDSNNNPHVCFPEGTDIAYVKRTGGNWTNPTILGQGEDPAIAIDDNGTIYVIWDGKYRYNDGSGWAGTQTFHSGSYAPDAMGDGQYAHTVYQVDLTVWYTTISAEGGGPPQDWITVDSPNGGETWQVGSSHNITWSSSGSIDDVKIRYSTNSGSSWTTITSSTPNDGSYSWTIPDTPSGNCRVRVLKSGDNSIKDDSDSDFTISSGGGGSWITVTDPNGGENWRVGSSHNITWDSSGGINNVKIRYSTNSGSSWTTITSSTPNDGSYSWTIPDTPSGNCRVRLLDASDSGVKDDSNADFTISTGGGGGQWITVTTPNGGEAWEPGSSQLITWDSSGDFPYVRIDYSTNSGQSWIKVASRTSNDGSRDWTIPDTPSSDCRLRIRNKDNSAIQDESDSDFTIGSGGGGGGDRWITVTNPNGGETWTVGAKETITWDASNNIAEVRLWWSTDSGDTWTLLRGRTPNDGSYTWTVDDIPSDNCRIKAQEYGNRRINDASDADFTILSDGGVLNLTGSDVPTTFNLWQNYPNPFNPSTDIRFDIPEENDSGVSTMLIIYDARGRLVKTLLDRTLPAGRYRVHWDGKNDAGEPVNSGIYLLSIRAGSHIEVMKMVLSR